MNRLRLRLAATAIAVTVSASVASGCGLVSSSGTFHDATLPGGDRPLADSSLVVTSKSFTEGVLLGKITATYLAAAGAKVTDLTARRDPRPHGKHNSTVTPTSCGSTPARGG